MHPAAELVYRHVPHGLQDLLITLFDLHAYNRRRSGRYAEWLDYHRQHWFDARPSLLGLQANRLQSFLRYVSANSPFYRQLWAGVDVDSILSTPDLVRLPVVSKEDIRQNIDSIATISSWTAHTANTGGTTGKSLTVRCHPEDIQERAATLDCFREQFGWKLGMRTAWFSGKDILTDRDIRAKRFWKTDHAYNIRYYSTFALASENLPYYIADLNDFLPEYLSGFPSSIFDIAHHARVYGPKLTCRPVAAFTTAEALIPEQADVIAAEFGTRVADQYASSEGAPFIVQCTAGRRHMLPTTGVFEVIDHSGAPASAGEILVTSFSTRGTPLVRYRIGDEIELSEMAPDSPCDCGSYAPQVAQIRGRAVDFLESPDGRRVNVVNVANSVKYSNGVIQFQAIQDSQKAVRLQFVVDPNRFSLSDERLIMSEFRARLGTKVELSIEYVDQIPREASGKCPLVKNLVRRTSHGPAGQ